MACEVLIGHGECNIQVETSEQIGAEDIEAIVSRIAGEGIETRVRSSCRKTFTWLPISSME